jgi:exodeoxyribonuclease-5
LITAARELRLKAKSLDDEGRTVSCVVNNANFLGIDGDLYEARRTNSFDFGYALTVHKAQGSQWDTVILMDEWSREFRKEWLYTGVTRAAKSITVVQR